MDGIDLLPHLQNPLDSVERTIFWRTYRRTRHKAVRSGAWKYLRIDAVGDNNVEVGEYLFNLETDPGERTNLRAERPDLFEGLRDQVRAWEEDVLPPLE